MSAILLDGEAVAARIRAEVAQRVAELAAEGVHVGLGTVLVGDDVPSERYVALKHEDCAALGIHSVGEHLPATATEQELMEVIARFNADPKVSAFLVQLPLPDGLDEERALLAVDPAKDVDGLHPVNLGRLVLGTPGPLPNTPAGIVELLHAYDVPVEGRHVVIIGRGVTIGRPLANLLTLKRPECNAAVTVVHTGVAPDDLAAITRTADIVVAAAGRPHLLTPDMVRPGAAVVSAGSTFEGRRLIPDAHPDVAEVAGWITPRLGGVGPDDPGDAVAQRGPRGRAGGAVSGPDGREHDERPWGSYTVLSDEAADHKVKRIVVHPGRRLSYQRHSKRAEHWFMVAGTAEMTLDGVVTKLGPGQSVDIPLEGAHRIANIGDTDLVFIEVQRGTYFGEDDIVRLEDDYGREEGPT